MLKILYLSDSFRVAHVPVMPHHFEIRINPDRSGYKILEKKRYDRD